MRSKLTIPFAASAIACGVAVVLAACGNGSCLSDPPLPSDPDARADARAPPRWSSK
ncbi:hypothetical protein QFZ97_004687 [Paraburkholderia youngii]